ncbi:MAG: type IV pilus modification protein PilV [Betaproteobacteria bacterium]|nr:type IV pilus modification protein PilV [Betaproteobacteria bacterium]
MRKRSTNRQRGISLIEILVAIVILSIGLLGVAGLQLMSIKGVGSSAARTTAAQLAGDMIERIRSNLAAPENGAPDYLNAALYTTSGSAVDCFTVACNAADAVRSQARQWMQKLAVALPSGSGIVCRDSTPNDGVPGATACDNVATAPYVVKVWWDDRQRSGGGGGSSTVVLQRFTTSFLP